MWRVALLRVDGKGRYDGVQRALHKRNQVIGEMWLSPERTLDPSPGREPWEKPSPEIKSHERAQHTLFVYFKDHLGKTLSKNGDYRNLFTKIKKNHGL